MNSDSSSGSSVRRLRDRQRENTAQEILSAAEQVFVEHGIFATHMTDIAARAGMAVGTLYNHYKDRDALLNALAAQRKSELLERVDKCLAEIDGKPFTVQLRDVLHAICTHFEAHAQFFAMLHQTECAPPALSAPAQVFQRELYSRYSTLVERGKKQRVLRQKTLKIAASVLMGITRAILLRSFYLPEEGKASEHLDTLVDFFLKGAEAKRS